MKGCPLRCENKILTLRIFIHYAQKVPHVSVNNAQLQLEQIRSEVKQLRIDMDETLHDQNDINESTRAQLDAISTALAELQAKPSDTKTRKPIGFIQPEDDDDKK